MPTFIHPIIAALVVLLPLEALEINVAEELDRIETQGRIALQPFTQPGDALDRKFRHALEDLEASAKATSDDLTLKAVRDALWKLDSGQPWSGGLSHPEIVRLVRIYREARRKIDDKHGPSIDRVEQDMQTAYRLLEQKLAEGGQDEDAGIVRKVIDASIAEAEQRRLLRIQIREAPTEAFEIPPLMASRLSPETRARAIERAGGDPTTEQAVTAGLRHLASTQAPDGSWGQKSTPYAMTGLGLLAFLGHGEGPWSSEFGEVVRLGISYLVTAGLERNGFLISAPEPNPGPYEHAIATYALAEAAILCAGEGYEVPGLRSVVRQAGQHIISSQHLSGGWDYGYHVKSSRGGDLSITAWQLQALHACRLTGMVFDGMEKAEKRGLEFVANCQRPEGAFAYKDRGGMHSPNGYATLTGAGVLLHQLQGKTSAGAVRRGADYILKESRFDYTSADSDLYGHFYEARAMYFRGGEQWTKYRRMVFKNLMDAQSPDGSWPPPGNGQKLNAVAAAYQTNEHYRNCLCLLILETYYRTAPHVPAPE